MKILFINKNNWPHVGGVEKHIFKLSQNLKKEGHKVKLTVKFKGREMAHKELGLQVLQEALNLLGDKVAVDRESKFEGRKLSMIVGKGRTGKNEIQHAEAEKQEISI